jgi:hypothetical protein
MNNETQTIRVIRFNKYNVALLLIFLILGIYQFIRIAIDFIAVIAKWLIG